MLAHADQNLKEQKKAAIKVVVLPIIEAPAIIQTKAVHTVIDHIAKEETIAVEIVIKVTVDSVTVLLTIADKNIPNVAVIMVVDTAKAIIKADITAETLDIQDAVIAKGKTGTAVTGLVDQVILDIAHKATIIEAPVTVQIEAAHTVNDHKDTVHITTKAEITDHTVNPEIAKMDSANLVAVLRIIKLTLPKQNVDLTLVA